MADTGYMEATTCTPVPNQGWTFSVTTGDVELGRYTKLVHAVTRRCMGWSWTATNGTTGTAPSELKAVKALQAAS